MEYPIEVICEGRNFDISVRYENFPPLPGDLEEFVENHWSQLKKNDPGIPDTPMLAAHLVQYGDNVIELVCGPSSRRIWMGTTQGEAMRRWPEHVQRGISMLAVTLADFEGTPVLVLGVRKPKITYPLQRHCVPAGRLEVSERDLLHGLHAE